MLSKKSSVSLHQNIRKELQQYYQRTSFADPFHITGWYRVDDFLYWLEKQEADLMKSSVRLETSSVPLSELCLAPFQTPARRRVCWFYLGGRYVADRYGVATDFSRLSIWMTQLKGVGAWEGGGIFFSTKTQGDVATCINTGIHEVTHVLPYLAQEDTRGLTELATFYSQYNYGLPVKANQAPNLAVGIRDVRLTHQRRPDLDILNEYNYFIAGILLNATLTAPEARQLFAVETGGRLNVSIAQTIAHLVAAKDHLFFIEGREEFDTSPHYLNKAEVLNYMSRMHFTRQDVARWEANPGTTFYLGKFTSSQTPFADIPPATQIHVLVENQGDEFVFLTGYNPIGVREYLKLAFGSHAEEVSCFYDKLLGAIPPQMTQDIMQRFPVQTEHTFFRKSQNRKLHEVWAPYQTQLEQAVLQALQECGAPPTPALPAGYL
ncbi:MAG: hypothetical protein MJ053_06475 [Elusimicrobiaceae bacterium]|nr:hypothetical protein [Elusimicrobiaceae bacterium]